jgi:hypothetical protein
VIGLRLAAVTLNIWRDELSRRPVDNHRIT